MGQWYIKGGWWWERSTPGAGNKGGRGTFPVENSKTIIKLKVGLLFMFIMC